MPDDLSAVIAEMRTMARVAGQASVEQLDPVLAGADARFAEYTTQWADRLEALVIPSPHKEGEGTRVDEQTVMPPERATAPTNEMIPAEDIAEVCRNCGCQEIR